MPTAPSLGAATSAAQAATGAASAPRQHPASTPRRRTRVYIYMAPFHICNIFAINSPQNAQLCFIHANIGTTKPAQAACAHTFLSTQGVRGHIRPVATRCGHGHHAVATGPGHPNNAYSFHRRNPPGHHPHALATQPFHRCKGRACAPKRHQPHRQSGAHGPANTHPTICYTRKNTANPGAHRHARAQPAHASATSGQSSPSPTARAIVFSAAKNGANS